MPIATHLTAIEAAALLGISVPTLYAYVSRGMLVSSPDAHGKHRLYDAAEVRRLARRKADGKRAGKVAQKVLDWGVPVLESSITLIADGHLLYRGHDAVELARNASLEDVAALLWECSARRIAEAPGALLNAAQWGAWLKLWATARRSTGHSCYCRPPLRRCRASGPKAATLSSTRPAPSCVCWLRR